MGAHTQVCVVAISALHGADMEEKNRSTEEDNAESFLLVTCPMVPTGCLLCQFYGNL